jgi:hypothetical protein
MNKMTPNKKRMQAYAKRGGLMGYRNGGDVLDQKQFGGVARFFKTAAKKIAPKIKKIYTDFQGTTVDPTLLKNTGYARQVDLDKAIKHRKKSTGSN